MSCWLQRKGFHSLRLWAILTLAHDPSLIRFVRKNAGSSLISVRNTNLKSIVIESGIEWFSAVVVFGLENLEKLEAVAQTLRRPSHHVRWITDGIVEASHQSSTGVTVLELGRGTRASAAAAVEVKGFPEEVTAFSGWTSMIIRYCDFFSGFDGSDRMDCFVLLIFIPVVVRVWDTAVIDEADCRVNSTHCTVRSTRQSICLEDGTERVTSRGFVVQRQELTLRCFG